jgi:tRNA-dihydrouridine synthase B
MQIGNVVLENNVFLAPMAGVTDMPFRILCREKGAGLVYTEMVSAKGMHYNDQKSFKLTLLDEGEMPGAVQIFGSEPAIMADTVYKLNDSNASIIDINMGCPMPKITKNGEGSALMLKPELVGNIVKEVVKASVKPVTVKVRKGWDDEKVNAVEIAKIAEANGAKAVAVHGRTREQLYSDKADWGIIKKVKEAVSIPVIGNGDIVKPEDAKSMLEQTGCDAIMIGRGAQGNPWLFERITAYLKDGSNIPEPSHKEKIDTIIRHMKMLIVLKGDHIGICEMRKHVAWYIKGMRNSTYVKEKVFKMTNAEDIVDLLKEYMEIDNLQMTNDN